MLNCTSGRPGPLFSSKSPQHFLNALYFYSQVFNYNFIILTYFTSVSAWRQV